MPSSFTIFGLTFHLYGLLVGMGMVAAMYITEKRLHTAGKRTTQFSRIALGVLAFGLLGARTWHVITDWPLYQDSLQNIFLIWQGGLSIIGAIAGGIAGAWLLTRRQSEITLTVLLDAMSVGVPVGQAIGRIGNWINHELYGLPTQIAWKQYVPPAYRVTGFEDHDYFHPLFAYEIMTLSVMAALIWQLQSRRFFALGTGHSALLYLSMYSIVRFFLDFLRIEKTMFASSSLSINQVVVGVAALLAGAVLLYEWKVKTRRADVA